MERTGVSLAHDAAFFVALLATALALGGALAHVLELPNKIGMSHKGYFIVQRVYLGWNRLAYLLLIELAGMLAVIFLYRAQPSVLWPALVALSCLLAAPKSFSGSSPSRPTRQRAVGLSSPQIGKPYAGSGSIRIWPGLPCRRSPWRRWSFLSCGAAVANALGSMSVDHHG